MRGEKNYISFVYIETQKTERNNQIKRYSIYAPMVVHIVCYDTFPDYTNHKPTPPPQKKSAVSLTRCQLLEFACTSIGFFTSL